MATEPAPAEINLREPRKRGRDFSALLWLGGWGVATEPEPSASTNEFGLDLGGALTLDGVQQRWTTVKANFGPLLSNLHPLAAPERRQGKTGYRLVVGPLPNSPAATGLCAHFNAAHTPCRAEGEQIAQR